MRVSIGSKEFEVADEPKDFWGWVAEGRYNSEWYILEKYVRPEHLFLDLGAWVGSHSLFASTITSSVLAFEPDPVAFAILEQNAQGGANNIAIHRGAIAGHEGMITLGSGLLGASTTRMNPEAGGGIGRWEPGQQFVASCTTLRKFVERSNLQDPLFIKMDVEGAEEQILTDIEFFEEHRPTLYLENHPWWWRDVEGTWKAIRKIAALYGKAFDMHLRPVDVQSDYPSRLLLVGEEKEK